MKSEPKTMSAPTSGSAQPALPANKSGCSKQLAIPRGAPVVELERRIIRYMDEARRQQDGLPKRVRKYAHGFYEGQLFALANVLQWLPSEPSEQALARNDQAEARLPVSAATTTPKI